ncbi:MAG: hypothetical protein M3445_01860 [Actinomycetota bacterium]|nr:hypothetical protein [Actinomycetota bacterium]
MRLPYAYVIPLAVLFAACSSGGDDSSGSAPEPPPPSTSSPSSTEPSACPEIRAGIDDFNAGDYESTVERFEAALPLAQAEDDEEDSAATADLLEAVEYYAVLPPEDYLEAAASSPEFAKYKAITLGQCDSGVPPEDSEGPDVFV